jgi:hypothetical protein
MQNDVVSLGTAWKLQGAGFPQEVEFCWSEYDGDPFETPDGPRGHWGIFHTDGVSENCPAAPTAQEIADKLASFELRHVVVPLANGSAKYYQAGFDLYHIDPRNDESVIGPNMAEALAELWLKIKGEKRD